MIRKMKWEQHLMRIQKCPLKVVRILWKRSLNSKFEQTKLLVNWLSKNHLIRMTTLQIFKDQIMTKKRSMKRWYVHRIGSVQNQPKAYQHVLSTEFHQAYLSWRLYHHKLARYHHSFQHLRRILRCLFCMIFQRSQSYSPTNQWLSSSSAKVIEVHRCKLKRNK